MSSKSPEAAAQAINSFDDATKRELATFIEQEQGKLQLQQTINQFTERCIGVCQVKLNEKTLRRKDEECLSTCVNRFLDASTFLVSTLQQRQ